MLRPLLLFLALGTAASAQAQSTMPTTSKAIAATSDIPMADYLGLLTQISPAAREGAELYLQAFEQRCRRRLTVAELRRAVSEGNGDPVLMGLIRASQLGDANVKADLAKRVECGGRR